MTIKNNEKFFQMITNPGNDIGIPLRLVRTLKYLQCNIRMYFILIKFDKQMNKYP